MSSVSKNKFISIIFVVIFIINSVYGQDIHPTKNKNIFVKLSGGIHGGDGRFEFMPIYFLGAGFKLTQGLSIKLEYSQIFVKVKNNNYPPFRYQGITRYQGDEFTIDQYFISIEGNLFKDLWIDFGIAPEDIFSVKTGLYYNFNYFDPFILSFNYDFLMIGRPIYNSRFDAFLSNAFHIGVQVFIF